VADWGGGMSASCEPRVQLFAGAGNGWPHSALRYHQFMPISCHFRDCKALLVTSLTHVRGAVALPFTFTFTQCKPGLGSVSVGSVTVGGVTVGGVTVGSVTVGSVTVGSVTVGSVTVGSVTVGSVTG